jgi:hypothetical protein
MPQLRDGFAAGSVLVRDPEYETFIEVGVHVRANDPPPCAAVFEYDVPLVANAPPPRVAETEVREAT